MATATIQNQYVNEGDFVGCLLNNEERFGKIITIIKGGFGVRLFIEEDAPSIGQAKPETFWVSPTDCWIE